VGLFFTHSAAAATLKRIGHKHHNIQEREYGTRLTRDNIRANQMPRK
jgi:hypothetical protein